MGRGGAAKPKGIQTQFGFREVERAPTRTRGVAWPNTSPCQGEDRRFKSGRVRQRSVGTLQERFFFCGEIVMTMTPKALSEKSNSGELTLQKLQQKHRGTTGGLTEGRLYEVVRTSMGQSDGLRGGENDTDRAHLVLRCPHTGVLFLILPTLEYGPGADGGTYDWEGLHCAPLQAE